MFRPVLAVTFMRPKPVWFYLLVPSVQHKAWHVVRVQDIVVELINDDSLCRNRKLKP